MSTFASSDSKSAKKLAMLTAGNAFGIATLMYNDYGNLWKLKCFIALAKHNKKWQGQANKTLRDVNDTPQWLHDQVTNKFMLCMSDIMQEATNEATLENCGFVIPGRGKFVPMEEMTIENEMATVLPSIAST